MAKGAPCGTVVRRVSAAPVGEFAAPPPLSKKLEEKHDSYMEAVILFLFVFCMMASIFIGKAIFNAIDKEATKKYLIERHKLITEIEEREKQFKFEIEAQEKIFNEKYEEFPWAKSFYENFIAGLQDAREAYLRYKNKPALRAADIVKETNEKLKEKESEILLLKSTLIDYHIKFPWLKNFRHKKKSESETECVILELIKQQELQKKKFEEEQQKLQEKKLEEQKKCRK